MNRVAPPRLALAFAGALMALSASAASTLPSKEGEGVVISGSKGLPDLRRGVQAASDGRTEDAERDLLPLAQRGYLEAQTALARVYGRMDTDEALQKSIHWWRAVLPQAPDVAQVPLARVLVRSGQEAEAEQLLRDAYTQRGDVEALGQLIRLYSDNPGDPPDPERAAQLSAWIVTAEQLDRTETNAALIHWYRLTPTIEGHPERLLALCEQALDLAPECYVDLIAKARADGDKKRMRQLASAVLSNIGAARLPVTVAASVARTLVNDSDDGNSEPVPVSISEAPEADDGEDTDAGLARAAPAVASADKSCPQAPVGVAAPSAPAPGVATPGTGDAGLVHANLPPPPVVNPPPSAPATANNQAPPSNADPEIANEIVRRLAKGDAEAKVLAAGVAVRYPYLAPELDLEQLLKAGQQQNVPEAPLYLGELYLSGARALRDPVAARTALESAAAVKLTEVQAHFFLGRLYQYGYLDEADPAHARDELLKAARAGYVSGDRALARLFATGKGVCPNLTFAYVFARLGMQDATPPIRLLMSQIRGAMNADQVHDGERLLQIEYAARTRALPGYAPAADAQPAASADSSVDPSVLPVAAPSAVPAVATPLDPAADHAGVQS